MSCLDISTCMFSGTLLGVGVSCLEKVNLKCSRTIVTLGFSLMLGMTVSQFIAKNPYAINTGRYRKQNDHVIHTCDVITIIFMFLYENKRNPADMQMHTRIKKGNLQIVHMWSIEIN